MSPDDRRLALDLNRLARRGAELPRDALRARVVRMDQRDQRLDAVRIRPVAHTPGALRRVAVAPVVSRERPPELGDGMFARDAIRRDLPDGAVPDVEPDTTDYAAFAHDREMSDAVLAPPPQPALDRLDRGRTVTGHAADPAHHLRVTDVGEEIVSVVERRLPQ